MCVKQMLKEPKSIWGDSSSSPVERKPPTQRKTVAASRAWPDSDQLVLAEYQPLEVFSPSAGGPSTARSEEDDICELSIRLREIELHAMMGEAFDTLRCRSTYHNTHLMVQPPSVTVGVSEKLSK